MGSIRVYTRGGCPSCSRVLLSLQRTGVKFTEVDVERQPQQWEKLCIMCSGLQVTDLPQVFFGFKHIGGVDEILELERSGRLEEEIAHGLADTGFDLSQLSSKLGSESKQTTTDVSAAEVSVSISEIDEALFGEGSEEDVFVQMRIKEAVMSWSGARVTPAASESEGSGPEASEEGEEETTHRRRTRSGGAGGNGARLTPVDAVKAVARAVGVLPAGPSSDEARGRTPPGAERNTDGRGAERPEESERNVKREVRSMSTEEAPRGGQELAQKREMPEEEVARGETVGGEQTEKRQRIKTAIRTWTGSEELEPQERIEQAIKLWKGEEEQQQGLSSPAASQARGKGINSRTRGLLPITSGRRISSPEVLALEAQRQPRLSGVLGLRESVRLASTNATKGEKWEQCWFVLYDSELLCFHSQKDQKRHAFPIHTWFLSCAQVSVPMITSTQGKGSWGQSHVLRLRIVMGKVLSEYFLSAKSKRGLDRWILELNQAIESTGPATPSSPVPGRRVKSDERPEDHERSDLS